MSESTIKTAYVQDDAATYDLKRFSTDAGQTIHKTELGILRKALELMSTSSTVLEVGCGTGRLLVETQKEGFMVNGMDPSPDMLRLSRKKVDNIPPYSRFTLGEAAKLPFSDNSYDFVYSIRVLNQTESQEYALKIVQEMLRVTKGNGYVLIEFMNSYRPPFNEKSRRNVLLRPKDVMSRASQFGGKLVWCRGAFMFSMGLFRVVPRFLLRLVVSIDRNFCKLLPKGCTRTYILFQKQK